MGDECDHYQAPMIQVKRASALTKTQSDRVSGHQYIRARDVTIIMTVSITSVRSAPYQLRADQCASADIADRAGATTYGLDHFPLG